MSDPGPSHPPEGQLLREAATWFARMRGPDAEASREEFEAWLKRGALHRQAYNRASEIFSMGKLLADDAGADSSDAAPASGPLRGRTLGWVLGALVILLAAGWLLLGPLRSSDMAVRPIADAQDAAPRSETLSTRDSSPRSFRLADGSIVSLQPDSKLEVRFEAGERRLDLRQGQVRFQVSPEARPFVVHAGGGRVVATGTVFDVGYATGRRVVVRLIEGEVEVTPPPGQGSRTHDAQQLQAGEQTSYSSSPVAVTASMAEVASAAPRAPRPAGGPATSDSGLASDYGNVSVGDLVAAANRGGQRPIRLADPSIAALRVSGRFRVDDPPLLAERLVLLFDLVRVDNPSGEIVLRLR